MIIVNKFDRNRIHCFILKGMILLAFLCISKIAYSQCTPSIGSTSAGPCTWAIYATFSGSNYQWLRNGTAISGATSSSITVTEGGSYTLRATVSGCSSQGTSSPIAISNPPVASISPSGNTSFCSGGSVTLTAQTGTGYTYQWLKGGSGISGATSSSYTATETGNYTVRVANGACSKASNSITVTVTSGSVSIGSSGTNVCSGPPVTLYTQGTYTGHQWYLNNSAIAGATSSTYSATQGGTYYLSAISCGARISSNSIALSGGPSISPQGNPNVCQPGGSITLSVSSPDNTFSYQWRKDGANISGATGTSYTASSSGGYTVMATKAPASCESNSIPVNFFTINTTITPQGSLALCSGGSVTLSAASGYSVYVWYKDGVNVSGPTTSANTWVATSAGSYTVLINHFGCSQTSSPVVVTAATTPVPTIDGAPTACTGTGGYSYSTEAGKSNYSWAAPGGSIISGSGTNTITVNWNTAGTQGVSVSYTDPVCGVTTSTTTKNIAVTQVNAPVFSIGPTAACVGSIGNTYSVASGFSGYTWSVSSGGTVTSGLNTNSINVTWHTGGAQTVSIYYSNGSCVSPTSVRNVSVNAPGIPSSPGASSCGQAPVTLTGTPGASANTIRWYSAVTGGTLLATATSYTTPVLSASTTYYLSSFNTSTGCEGTDARVPVIVTIHAVPATPTGINATRCGAGTVVLTGTPGINSNTLRWYAAITGGTPLATGSSFTTPSLSTTTTYYISSFNTTTNCESTTARVAVTATIHADPGSPTEVSASRCGPGTLTLSATAGANATAVRWYTAATGGTLLATGLTYTTPSLSATTTYYINSINATTGCESSSARVPVTASVQPIPASPQAIASSRYGAGAVTLSAVPGANANSVKWYTTPTGGTGVIGVNFTTPSLTATTTYYATSYNTLFTCESTVARLAVNAIINPPLTETSYPVGWAELQNMVQNGNNSLYKSGGTVSAWDAGAVGLNLLKSQQDGWIEFTVSSTTHYFMAGLSRFNGEAPYSTIDYAAYLNGTNLAVYEAGTSRGNISTVVVGDKIRIARIGTQIRYSKNGTVLRTVNTTKSWNLRPDVSVVKDYVPELTCSFDRVIYPIPMFVFPAANNSGGSITINPIGGNLPYTYAWTGGETTQTISNKSRGAYTVTVGDLNSRSVSKTYNLGYPVEWTKITGATLHANNSLLRPASPRIWDAGASSINSLPASTDGWLEFVYDNVGSHFMVGFSRTDLDVNYTTIDYAFYLTDGGDIIIYEGNVSKGSFGSLVKGDIFKIAREGVNIVYYVNGISVRTIAAPVERRYIVDVSLALGSTPVLTTSFDKQMIIKPSIILPADLTNTGGSIATDVSGGYMPITYSWSTGQTTAGITGRARGAYTITTTDAASRTKSKTYNLAYPIIWTDLQNAVLNTDNTVSKGPGAESSVVSSNALMPSTDGFIEFVVNNIGRSYVVGLSRPNSITAQTSIDYAFSFEVTGEIYIKEAGVNKILVGYLTEGDVFKISRQGANINYYWNDTLVKTTVSVASYLLIVDSFIASGSLPLVTSSFPKTSQTFYAIANGNWNSAATWSLTEGGAPAQLYPAKGDIVYIKGYNVVVSSGIYCSTVNVVINNTATCLRVDGIGSSLNVHGQVNFSGAAGIDVTRALLVQNDGEINILTP